MNDHVSVNIMIREEHDRREVFAYLFPSGAPFGHWREDVVRVSAPNLTDLMSKVQEAIEAVSS